MLGEALNSNLAGSVLIVSATLGSIAAGIPLPVLAAPLISAGGLALALESRQLRDYALFAVGGATTAAWFIVHHFWFLDVNLQARFSGQYALRQPLEAECSRGNYWSQLVF